MYRSARCVNVDSAERWIWVSEAARGDGLCLCLGRGEGTGDGEWGDWGESRVAFGEGAGDLDCVEGVVEGAGDAEREGRDGIDWREVTEEFEGGVESCSMHRNIPIWLCRCGTSTEASEARSAWRVDGEYDDG